MQTLYQRGKQTQGSGTGHTRPEEAPDVALDTASPHLVSTKGAEALRCYRALVQTSHLLNTMQAQSRSSLPLVQRPSPSQPQGIGLSPVLLGSQFWPIGLPESPVPLGSVDLTLRTAVRLSSSLCSKQCFHTYKPFLKIKPQLKF